MREGSGEFPKGTQEGRVEDMADIEDFECSIELPIGIRFYFWDHIYEVAELEDEIWGCSKCAFPNEDICVAMNCDRQHRHDGKCTYFKEVEKSEENNNG